MKDVEKFKELLEEYTHENKSIGWYLKETDISKVEIDIDKYSKSFKLFYELLKMYEED